MRNNQLTSIPALTHCVNLKELHLGANRITSLAPEQLETILNVRMLDLRENKITRIPDEIHVLQLLERLDVSNNDLSALPFTLGVFVHLSVHKDDDDSFCQECCLT